MNGAIARIFLRYLVGGLLGSEVGKTLAGDSDIVLLVAAGIGFILAEGGYWLAKRYGWKT